VAPHGEYATYTDLNLQTSALRKIISNCWVLLRGVRCLYRYLSIIKKQQMTNANVEKEKKKKGGHQKKRIDSNAVKPQTSILHKKNQM